MTGPRLLTDFGHAISYGIRRREFDDYLLRHEFAALLRARGFVSGGPVKWKGHAYLLDSTSHRRVHDTGVVVAGDAAGLALSPGGEGILAAVESGLLESA